MICLRLRALAFLALFATIFTLGCGTDGASGPGSDAGGQTSDAPADDAGSCAPGQHPDGMGGCTADACTPNPCLEMNRTTCVAQGNVSVCRCNAGTHDESGKCVPDQGCLPSTCNMHGTCTASSGAVSCACAAGWGSAHCDACDAVAGFHSDGLGGCTKDLCLPSPCTATDRHCVVASGAAQCACNAGTHDQGGNCVPDTTCTASTCSAHGTCATRDAGVSCTCTAGWGGATCAVCDASGGFHSDGSGGCTKDKCLPNPCATAHKSTCTTNASSDAVCGCDLGYHDDGGGSCVVDETCTASSCGGHGACSVVSGKISCVCSTGFTGATCAACTSGYHDDGLGGCTQDPCTPNHCTTANKTVCTATSATYTCSCVAGYHDDGAGGCSNDPCTPNTCLAQNKSCRVTGGVAECFTPACDDGNPCTTDAVSGGSCTHAALGNGTACQTSLCAQAQTCQSGTCSVGTPVSCDDGNPCTSDTCTIQTGCGHANNDAAVPTDAVACMKDSCSAGVVTRTPTNALCDDGLFCDGAETCEPLAVGADARGCKTTPVTAPSISPSPCRHYGACNEASKSFPLVTLAAGTSCNDGIGCTTGDSCDALGVCRGSATASCSPTTCTASTPFSGNIDIPEATVGGHLTQNGSALPSTYSTYDGGNFYLVAKDTGAWHELADYQYWYSGGSYVLHADTYASRLVPGVYDLLYRRHWDRTSNLVTQTAATDTQVNGLRYLKRDIVIGLGSNQLDVDIPMSTVSGHITQGGAPLPATYGTYDGGSLYLVAKDTGAWHSLADYSYWYASGSYVLHGDSYASKMVAGTYDLVYRRHWDSASNIVTRTDGTDAQVNGERTLKANVVIGAGSNTLDIDIPVATVTGSITQNGAPLPATYGTYDGGSFYLVSTDTGAWHSLADYSYWYSAGSYVLHGDTYSSRLVPGTYDLAYRRHWDKASNIATQTAATDTQVNGERFLVRGVVIAAGANALNIDIPVATVSGSITQGGAALPATYGTYDGGSFYLVAKDSGAWHSLADYSYWYASGSYVLHGDTYSSRIVPGTYDLVYRRHWDSASNIVTQTAASDTQINGLRVLRSNVVIGAGTSTLDLDIPVATVSGTITQGGAPLPATYGTYDGGSFYLVATETGAWHSLADYAYWYASGSYVLHGATFSSKILPGTYDLLYVRHYDATSKTVTLTDGADTQVNGMRLIQTGILIASGARTLNIDIPATNVSGAITQNQGPLPPTYSTYDGGDFFLVAGDTGARHALASYSYWYASGSYVLHGASYASRTLQGTYDLLYQRHYDAPNNIVTRTDVADTQVNARRLLDRCIAPP